MLITNEPHKTAAMQQMTYVPSGREVSPHQCDDSRGESEIKLACGCMMSVIVAGALSRDGQVKLKEWRSRMTPCCKGWVNDTTTLVLRDTGSTTCVVKSSLVKPEQMTGSYEVCMLIDGVVKRYLTAIVDLKSWHPILYWHGKSVVHGHISPGHNCWQYTRCSWLRHRHKTTRCQIYITVYRY